MGDRTADATIEGSRCVRHAATASQGIRCASCLRSFCPLCVSPRDVFFICRDCANPAPVAVESSAGASDVEPVTATSAAESARRPSVPEFAAEPAAVEQTQSTASLLARLAAFLIDFFVVFTAEVFLGSVLHSSSNAVLWRLLGIAIVYEALFVQERGQTLGKAAADIHVVSADGKPPSAVQAWMRALTKALQFSCCGATLLGILLNRPRRGIHDLVAGTRVVKKVNA